MDLESLDQLERLPIATSNKQVDERVNAVLDFSERHSEFDQAVIAESLMNVMSYVSWCQKIADQTEVRVVRWIEENFNEEDCKLMDAVASIYSSFTSHASEVSLNKMIKLTTNQKAREYLGEAKKERNGGM